MSPAMPCQTFLDALPEELCTRVALHLSNAKQTPSALALAQTSRKQRRAVLAALGYKLVVDDTDEHLVDWAAISHPDHRDLSLFIDPTYHPPHLAKLLSSPNLIHAHTAATPPFLSALVAAPAVRRLDLYYNVPLPQPGMLIEALRRLSLTHLKLVCGGPDVLGVRACLFRDKHAAQMLADAQPKLEMLAIQCACREENPLWDVVMKMPALKQVEVNVGGVPDMVLGQVRRMEEVRLLDEGEAWRTGLEVGESVVQIGLLRSPVRTVLDGDMMMMLGGFCRLKEISVMIAEGVECAMAETVKRLGGLEKIEIYWDRARMCLHDGKCEACYPSVVEGAVAEVARSLPVEVGTLHLCLCRMSLGEIEDVLEAAGGGLQSFMLSIFDQGEDMFVRLEKVLGIMARFCPMLTTFRVVDGTRDEVLYPNVMEQPEAIPRLLRALDRVRLRAPRLDPNTLCWLPKGGWD